MLWYLIKIIHCVHFTFWNIFAMLHQVTNVLLLQHSTTEHVLATALCTVASLKPERFVNITASQKSVWQKCFAKDQYPGKVTLFQFATRLELNESKVHNWFYHHRRRVARDKHETLFNGQDFVCLLMFIVLLNLNLLISFSLTASVLDGLVMHVHSIGNS